MRAGLLAIVCASCAPASAGLVTLEIRPDDERAMTPRFDPTDVIERFDSEGGEFAIHFTRMGSHAVSDVDADDDGTPDFVEDVAAAYDDALATYVGWGLRAPLGDEGTPEGDGGDGRFDVYLVDFTGGADGAFRTDECDAAGETCIGHVVQDRDFSHYHASVRAEAIHVLASHELFHAVQAAYDGAQTAVFGEGTAVWATESFDPSTGDLERFSGAYLGSTDRSLEQTASGPVDSYTYGAGVFFQFLAERYDDELVRGLVRDVENDARGVADPRWLDVLAAALERDHDTTFEDAWIEHARWNLRTASRGDALASYENGAAYGEITIEDLPVPHVDERVRMLRASSRSFRVPSEAASRVGIELVEPPARPGSREGIFVLVTAEAGDGTLGETTSAPAIDGVRWLDATAGPNAIVTLVRARDADDGSGRAPALCIGTEAQLAECRASIAVSDAGAASDASVPLDAGVVDASSSMSPPTEGCTCRASSGRRAGSLVPLVVVAIVLARRRRRT